jgi:hypothetical protein
MYNFQLAVAVIITAMFGGLILLTIIEYLIDTLPKKVWAKIGKHGSYATAIVAGFILSYSIMSQQLVENNAEVVEQRSTVDSKPIVDSSECTHDDVSLASNDECVQPDRDIVRDINGDIISEASSVGLLAVMNPIMNKYSQHDNIERIPHAATIKRGMSTNKNSIACDRLIGHEKGRYIDTG